MATDPVEEEAVEVDGEDDPAAAHELAGEGLDMGADAKFVLGSYCAMAKR
jgi:hypothetical protein